MASTTLTASIIAKEAVMILDNNLNMANKVYRGYENEFDKKVNGYEVGDTITVRKPTDFTVTDGATMAVQDTIEGSTTITVNKRKHIAFKFTSQDLTLKIGDLSERIIKPAMVQLANQIETDLMARFVDVPQWVGTPGQTVNSFNDFMLAPQRLDEYAAPSDDRYAMLSPADYYGMAGAQTALYINGPANQAYRNGTLGQIAGVDTYSAQLVPTLTTGSRSGSTTAIGASITATTITYDTAKNTNNGLTQQTISLSQMGGATQTVAAGDVFTISTVFAVNPVTKAALPYLKQFTVVTAATAATSAITNLTITPAIIWSGAFQNVSVTAGTTDLNTKVVTWVGSASTAYPQNLVFHKNAFALVSVPLVAPPGAVDVGRQTYRGTSVRVIPVYDGVNDESAWRLDILYGTKTLDPRLAVRLSGT